MIGETSAPRGRPLGAARAIVYGTLVVGCLDILDAMIFWGLWKDVPPIRIVQSIAAGLLGREAARHGGPPTAILGAALHFFIAFSVVAAYYLASRQLALLRDRPVLCGLLYGVLVYVVMTFVVVPLSAAFNPPLTAPSFVNGILGHALLIGLPSALFARRA